MEGPPKDGKTNKCVLCLSAVEMSLHFPAGVSRSGVSGGVDWSVCVSLSQPHPHPVRRFTAPTGW